MKLFDAVGSALDLLDTYLLIKANIWAWPIGIVAVLINAVLYYQVKLYADFSLQLLYLVSMAYGWYYWLHPKNNQAEVRVTRLSRKVMVCWLMAGVCVTGLISYLLRHYSPSTTPWWDASTTAMSLIAQWLTCRKKIENWLVWFVVDALYVGLYAYKDLPFHAIENSVYLVMAVMGYLNWRRLMVATENGKLS